ncbi:SusD/RagB family nutrient-binding outer membrane lipoprotein [Chitinophaga oryziterrae]|uniref:SusD/RagB family nutrient-binding outer membrane lipoprotein n=1 Tax=Chitinophaga oryziterrae TaxID=1031224 RepID=A0A6N8J8H3_9BACT|nr:SusD/RagB family nutrient-binding outer membrane lipoprotein [Chitinophaga oryziterrae]MVT40422.1 SusD/RagB family nutrient-binding outer membrane lipoprotein [Chitinophaga oryziterrae]
MKRLLINITALFLLAGTFSSCKKKVDADYLNPEKTAAGSLGKLLSGMYLNKRIHPSYWDYYTFIMPTLGLYTQTVATAPSTEMYIPSLTYSEGRWTDFYAGSSGTDYNYNGPGIMSNYREMQTTYAALSASEQAANLVFLKCAQVVLYDQTAQMIDLWGDIPFSQAGSQNTATRDISNSPFQDAASVYDTLITGLKDLNTYFDTATLSTVTTKELQTQDIVLGGDLSKWQRYANSLRLRLLMRISNYDEATAKTEVTTMLNNPSIYPLISDNTYNVELQESPSGLKSDLYDVFKDFSFGPAYLMDTLMVANDDPRTAVYWDTNASGEYKGFPYNGTTADYEGGGYATYDSATFYYNYNLPGVMFTASEVSFLKAEADERWGIGTAQTDYETGVTQSVDFYYGINQSRILRSGGGTWSVLTTPSSATVTSYLEKPAIAYTGTATEKLAKIYTQKWIHFFILQAGQSWAELRRTGYPVLQYAAASASGATTPPVRLLYPSTEQLYNSANYSAVSAKDTRDTKIFWDVN